MTDAQGPVSPQPTPGVAQGGAPKGSSKKWWFIGCGGCLGVLIIVAVAVMVLGGMGVNALKGASDEAIHNVFGPSYQANPNDIVIGFPLAKLSASSDISNMVMMIDQHTGRTIIALEKRLGAFEAKTLRSSNTHEIDDYMKQFGSLIMTNAARGSSSTKLHDIRFEPSHLAKLSNGKQFAMSDAVTEISQRGNLVYSPGVVALLPEGNDKLVALFAMGGKDTSAPTAEGNFKPGQQALEQTLLGLITESELDDRLK